MLQLPDPPNDCFRGKVILLPDTRKATMLIDHRLGKLPGKLLWTGKIAIGYGFPLLYELDFMLPQLAIDDFQRQYHGAEAIQFMLSKGNSYPRADAMGRRVSTGQREEFFFKEVDIAAGLHAFAYPVKVDGVPVAVIGEVIWLDQSWDSDTPGEMENQVAPPLLRLSTSCKRMNPGQLSRLAGLRDRAKAS